MSSKSGIIAGRELIDKIKNAKNGDDSLITCEKWKECKGKECEPDCSYGLDWNNFNGWQVDLNLGKEAYITGNKSPTILDENCLLYTSPSPRD